MTEEEMLKLTAAPLCRGVGMCQLRAGHSGVCVYKMYAPDQLPDLGAGTALIGLNESGTQVLVDYGRTGPWQWVAFDPDEALKFAETLIRMARSIKPESR